ncbi:pentatricopeptide repeat protein [Artemisia annua]|uniref:Pentatricopeptide repeat protein n=1 Tax=Artemisia annua TaxID=35608 RepID=A0A2U1KQ36_ARTAN|nr:pentatricopeptide repeat protein [Artemisia annua]
MCSLGLPVDYNTMKTVINSCCQLRCTNKGGFAVFGCCLKRGVIPNVFTFNTLLNGLIRENKILDAEILLKDLINKGICEPNAIMYNAIIKALCNLGGKTYVTKAVGYIRLMVERGRKPNLVGYSTIIAFLCKDQLIDEAFELFKEMQGHITPDVIICNSLIYGFCNSARWLEASDLLKEMMDNSISPNLQTFNILINEYSKRGKINRAEEVIFIMREKGFLPNIVTYNSLIDCYCKRGDMDSAKRILDSLVFRHAVPDIVTYNTVVYGYSMNRRKDMDQAMLVFDKMKAKGIKPNEFTYKSLITGFCSVGRFKEASKLVTVMHEEGLVPDRSAYRFLMEGFCRTKQVEDAFSLFTFMVDLHTV